jgi:hypothetical protein
MWRHEQQSCIDISAPNAAEEEAKMQRGLIQMQKSGLTDCSYKNCKTGSLFLSHFDGDLLTAKRFSLPSLLTEDRMTQSTGSLAGSEGLARSAHGGQPNRGLPDGTILSSQALRALSQLDPELFRENSGGGEREGEKEGGIHGGSEGKQRPRGLKVQAQELSQ